MPRMGFNERLFLCTLRSTSTSNEKSLVPGLQVYGFHQTQKDRYPGYGGYRLLCKTETNGEAGSMGLTQGKPIYQTHQTILAENRY